MWAPYWDANFVQSYPPGPAFPQFGDAFQENALGRAYAAMKERKAPMREIHTQLLLRDGFLPPPAPGLASFSTQTGDVDAPDVPMTQDFGTSPDTPDQTMHADTGVGPDSDEEVVSSGYHPMPPPPPMGVHMHTQTHHRPSEEIGVQASHHPPPPPQMGHMSTQTRTPMADATTQVSYHHPPPPPPPPGVHMSTQTHHETPMEVEPHPRGPPRPPKGGGLSPYGPARKQKGSPLEPPVRSDLIAQRHHEMAHAAARARHPLSVAASSSYPPPPPPPAGGVIAPHVSTERHRQPKRTPEHDIATEQEALLHGHLRHEERIEALRARRRMPVEPRSAPVKRMADLDMGPVKRRTQRGRGHFESLSHSGYKLGPTEHSFHGTPHRIG